MVQIVQRSPTFGETFGSGLSQGLQQLVQHKMSELAQRNQVSQGAKLWEQAGLPRETAHAIASQPEGIQKALLDRLEGLNFGSNKQQTQQGRLQQLIEQQQNIPSAQPSEFEEPNLQNILQQISPLSRAMSGSNLTNQKSPQIISQQPVDQLVQQSQQPSATKSGITLGAPSQERRTPRGIRA